MIRPTDDVQAKRDPADEGRPDGVDASAPPPALASFGMDRAERGGTESDHAENAPESAASSDAATIRRWARLAGPPFAAAAGALLWASAPEQSGAALLLTLAAATATGAALAVILERRQEARTVEHRAPPAPAPAESGLARARAAAVDRERRIFDSLPTPLLLLDGRGRISFANAVAVDELGRRAIGEHYAGVLRAPALVQAVNRAFSEDERSELAFSTHRGGERHLNAVVAPIAAPSPETTAASGGGEQPRALILIQDVTRMRRAEQLHRDFVANASHELKTPLSAISVSIETLLGPARGDADAQQRFLTSMATQARRMQRLVEDLLSLNRIELKEHVPPTERVDLRQVLLDAIDAAAAETEDARPVEIDAPTDPPPLRGDAAELTQLFSNLIANAHRYGRGARPPRVVARVSEEDGGRIGVTVEDFGPGVSKEHVPRLTERFYRVESGRSSTGTGLGLAIVKHVTARHRGVLEIDSVLGRGSRFTVWLPVAASH